jgi:hypothetical protein
VMPGILPIESGMLPVKWASDIAIVSRLVNLANAAGMVPVHGFSNSLSVLHHSHSHSTSRPPQFSTETTQTNRSETPMSPMLSGILPLNLFAETSRKLQRRKTKRMTKPVSVPLIPKQNSTRAACCRLSLASLREGLGYSDPRL